MKLDIERVDELTLNDIEIVESYNPTKIEIYMLDNKGERIEGGQFDRQEFLNVILDFYSKNY
jgi:hypothetical protein